MPQAVRYEEFGGIDVLQQESKALTRVRSQIRVPAISSSSAGTACRFNGYDERCKGCRGRASRPGWRSGPREGKGCRHQPWRGFHPRWGVPGRVTGNVPFRSGQRPRRCRRGAWRWRRGFLCRRRSHRVREHPIEPGRARRGRGRGSDHPPTRHSIGGGGLFVRRWNHGIRRAAGGLTRRGRYLGRIGCCGRCRFGSDATGEECRGRGCRAGRQGQPRVTL
jgi:hypothetical protein